MRRATFAAWGLASFVAASSILSPRAARAEDAISDEARRHFKAGVALMLDPDGERIEEAYREFREAYALSRSPKILGNMALCAMKLERDGEAIDAYSTYLRDVQDIDAGEREQIVRDLQTLTVGVVRVTVTVEPAGAHLVDVRVPNRGERITNIYGPIQEKLELGMRPGHHELTVKLAGYEQQTWEFEAHAGGREQHAFKLAKKDPAVAGRDVAPSSSSPGANVVPWVVAGVGGAMLVTGAITGVVALGKVKDIEKACPNDLCPPAYDLDDAQSGARSMATVTDVLLVGGAVLAVGGVTWALIANRSSGSDARATTARSGAAALPAFSGGCTSTGCAGSLRVRF